MKKTIAKINQAKATAITLFTLLIAIGFACNEELDADIKKMGEQSQNITFDQLPSRMQKALEKDQKKLTFIKLNTTQDELNDLQTKKIDFNSISQLKDLDPNLIHMVEVQKDQNEIFIAIKKEGANFDYLANTSKSDDEVFTIVEDPPHYPGGMEAFYKYIAENMYYPSEARRAGKEGRVFIQFTVDIDGSLIDVEAVKGVSPELDEEAIRVLKSVEKFEPGVQRGKAVKVRMVLPIIFKLDQEHRQNDQSASGIIAIDDVQNNKLKMVIKTNIQKDGISDEITWKGTVLNEETNEPIAGVNIIEEGTSNGTVSDIDGSFELMTTEKTNLIFSHISFKTRIIKFGGSE